MSAGPTREQIAADEAFLAKARKLSPKYPDIDEAWTRLQNRREALAARTLLFGTVAGLVDAYWHGFGFVIAGFCFVGFVVTCFVAGNRSQRKTR